MGLAENRAKNAAMAKYLKEKGFPHGRRQSRPAPNSGGLTMVFAAGSSKYQRRMAAKVVGKQ